MLLLRVWDGDRSGAGRALELRWEGREVRDGGWR